MPAKSKKQQKFLCADLGRMSKGKATKTGMSRKQLTEFCKSKVANKTKA